MLNQSIFSFVNPQNGHLAFRYQEFEDSSLFDHIKRNNYYSLIWVKEGQGKVKANFGEYDFTANSLFAFSQYQPYMFSTETTVKGIAIYFHSDFFCILEHHKEVACNGVLYNNIYQPPFVNLDETSVILFQLICDQIKNEIQNPALAQAELLISYLKIFLINAARIHTIQHQRVTEDLKGDKEPFILQRLKEAIDANYRVLHSPSEYAKLLNISPKALAKIAKKHFNKTLSSIINDRIVIEAKTELYLTNKTVKEIAFELGYHDEFYFSRFFKVNTDVSPQLYRETVGDGKNDS